MKVFAIASIPQGVSIELVSLGLLNETPGRHFNLTERGFAYRCARLPAIYGDARRWAGALGDLEACPCDDQGRSPERIPA